MDLQDRLWRLLDGTGRTVCAARVPGSTVRLLARAPEREVLSPPASARATADDVLEMQIVHRGWSGDPRSLIASGPAAMAVRVESGS